MVFSIANPCGVLQRLALSRTAAWPCGTGTPATDSTSAESVQTSYIYKNITVARSPGVGAHPLVE
jgi:hypothetical protein